MIRPASRVRAAFLISLASLTAPCAYAQTSPQTAPVGATTGAAAPAPLAKKPSFDELLAGKTAPFDYEDVPVNAVIDALGRAYGIEIENNYQADKTTPTVVDITQAKPGKAPPVPMITAKIAGAISVRDALGIINATIMPYGFAAVESVRLRDDSQHTPYAVLTILPTRKDAGAARPVFYGMNPDSIPEGDEIRTQVITLKNLDVKRAQETVAAVLAKNADIKVNEDRKMLIITDTATHVHSAAVVLQILDNQPAAK